MNETMWMVIALVLALWQVITVAVRLTPTKKDDEVVTGIGKFFNLLFNATRVRGAELEKIQGAVLAGLAEEYCRTAPKQSREQARELTRRCVARADSGLDLIPDTPRTIPGVILKTTSRAVKKRRMKTRFGKRLQNLFRRID